LRGVLRLPNHDVITLSECVGSRIWVVVNVEMTFVISEKAPNSLIIWLDFTILKVDHMFILPGNFLIFQIPSSLLSSTFYLSSGIMPPCRLCHEHSATHTRLKTSTVQARCASTRASQQAASTTFCSPCGHVPSGTSQTRYDLPPPYLQRNQ
jgi:hypothetical protein